MAYIGKFRDGWRAQVQRDGARVTKTFKLKKDAQAWALEQESKTTLRSDRTLRHACDNYLKTVSIHKRNAVVWESRRFDAFCAFVGEATPIPALIYKALVAIFVVALRHVPSRPLRPCQRLR